MIIGEKLNRYAIRGDTRTRKQELVYEANGKICSLPMPDIEGDLPSRIIYAKYPIDAVKKYWKNLKVEFRPAEVYVRRAGHQDEVQYIVDWAGWNECGSGHTGWWVLKDKSEYDKLRSNDGFALFILPRSRFIMEN
jgi:hypothetical protein